MGVEVNKKKRRAKPSVLNMISYYLSNNKKLTLIALIVLITVITFVIVSGKRDFRQETIVTPTVPFLSPSISMTPSTSATVVPTMTTTVKQETYKVSGIDSLDGSWDQAEEFKKNMCKITSNSTRKVAANCNMCNWNVDETSKGNICLVLYSQLKSGKTTAEGQYFVVTGGEGGSYWLDIYFLRNEDKSLELVERPRYTTDEDFSAEYDRVLNKYTK